MFLQRFFPAAFFVIIPLQSSWLPGPNQAPPFYIWQNDPGLTEYLKPNGTTQLCLPASISNALLYQYAFKENRASHLKIPGIVSNPTNGLPAVDSNAMVRYFTQACHSDSAGNTPIPDSANCIAQFYRESGYQNFNVRMIRNGVAGLDPSVVYEDRTPTLDDIQNALNQSYEIIASVVMMKTNSDGTSIKVGSHSFNIYGLTSEGIIVSNPTRAYDVNFIDPVFDVVSFKNDPTQMGIEVFGRTLERPNAHTFLVALTLIKPE